MWCSMLSTVISIWWKLACTHSVVELISANTVLLSKLPELLFQQPDMHGKHLGKIISKSAETNETISNIFWVMRKRSSKPVQIKYHIIAHIKKNIQKVIIISWSHFMCITRNFNLIKCMFVLAWYQYLISDWLAPHIENWQIWIILWYRRKNILQKIIHCSQKVSNFVRTKYVQHQTFFNTYFNPSILVKFNFFLIPLGKLHAVYITIHSVTVKLQLPQEMH